MPDRCAPEKISDDDAMARLREWEAAGGLVIEESVVAPVPPVPAEPPPRISPRGTSTAASTPRGGGRRTRA